MYLYHNRNCVTFLLTLRIINKYTTSKKGVESMITLNAEKKYINLLLYLLLIAFVLVTYTLDLYPGAHQIDYSDEQSFTITKKGMLHSEQHKVIKTEEYTLKVALIDYEVNFLKALWLAGIIVFSMFFINLVNLLEQGSIKPALIISAIYIVIFIGALFVYIDRFLFVNEVIKKLIV